MAKGKVEIFSAGCSVRNDTVDLVRRISCTSCDATVLNMNDRKVVQRAQSLGIRSVPAVVVDGKLASCCAGRGLNESDLPATGIVQTL